MAHVLDEIKGYDAHHLAAFVKKAGGRGVIEPVLADELFITINAIDLVVNVAEVRLFGVSLFAGTAKLNHDTNHKKLKELFTKHNLRSMSREEAEEFFKRPSVKVTSCYVEIFDEGGYSWTYAVDPSGAWHDRCRDLPKAYYRDHVIFLVVQNKLWEANDHFGNLS